MKKSIFVIAALTAVTFVNAQITLEHSFDEVISSHKSVNNQAFCITDDDIISEIPYESNIITLYDAVTYDIVTTIHFPGDWYFFAKNLFTTDNTYAVLCAVQSGGGAHWYVYDAAGQTMIADLGVYFNQDNSFEIYETTAGYKLAIFGCYGSYSAPYGTRIFSLPGNGVPTDLNEEQAPQHKVRKYLRNDQVMIDNDERTYNIQGKQVQ